MDITAFIQDKMADIPGLLITYAPSVLFALAILIFGRIFVRKVARGTETATQRIPNVDLTLAKFFGSLVLVAGTLAVLVFALSALKINLAFIATIVAALVVALGFALQDSLGDLASGIMLAIFRPFKIGEEVVVGGEHGVVREIGMFGTQLVTRDNIVINVGNGAVFGNTIKNFYAYGDRRLDMDFGVSYDADLNKAIKAITSAAATIDGVYDDPAPWAKVVSLGDSAVVIQLRVWSDTDKTRKIKMEMSKAVKLALDKAGIDIPYEHNMIVKLEA